MIRSKESMRTETRKMVKGLKSVAGMKILDIDFEK